MVLEAFFAESIFDAYDTYFYGAADDFQVWSLSLVWTANLILVYHPHSSPKVTRLLQRIRSLGQIALVNILVTEAYKYASLQKF